MKAPFYVMLSKSEVSIQAKNEVCGCSPSLLTQNRSLTRVMRDVSLEPGGYLIEIGMVQAQRQKAGVALGL